MKPAIHSYDPQQEYFFAEGCYINELANTPDDAQVSIARARVAPGVTTRWHYLTATTERYVLLEGSGLVEVAGLASRRVGPGDVVIIPPGAQQRIANTGDTDLVFLAICSPRFTPAAYVDADAASAL